VSLCVAVASVSLAAGLNGAGQPQASGNQAAAQDPELARLKAARDAAWAEHAADKAIEESLQAHQPPSPAASTPSGPCVPAGLEHAMKQALPTPLDLPKGVTWRQTKLLWETTKDGICAASVEYDGIQPVLNEPFGMRCLLDAQVLLNTQAVASYAFLHQPTAQAGVQSFPGLPDSMVEKRGKWTYAVLALKGTSLMVGTVLNCGFTTIMKDSVEPAKKDSGGLSFEEKQAEAYRSYIETLQSRFDFSKLSEWVRKEAPDKDPFVMAEAGRLATLIWSRLPDVHEGTGVPTATGTGVPVVAISPSAANVQAAGMRLQFACRLSQKTPQGDAPLARTPVTVTLGLPTFDDPGGLVRIDKDASIDAGAGSSTSRSTTGRTDADGRLTVTYESPVILDPRFKGGGQELTVVVSSGSAVRAAITLVPAGIRGRVVSLDPLTRKDEAVAGVPIVVYAAPGGKPVTATTNAEGLFLVPAATGGTYRLQVGRSWRNWNDPIDFIEDAVVTPASLTLVYDSLDGHYARLRVTGVEQRFLEWYKTSIVDVGLRGFNSSDQEKGFRQAVGDGSHPSVTSLGLVPQGKWPAQTNNDARVVDWFVKHGFGYIGRCGDLNDYIRREFRRAFSGDKAMQALDLADLEIRNEVPNPNDRTAVSIANMVLADDHTAPIIVPSIVFRAPRVGTVVWDSSAGEISPLVKVYGTVLDAYDSDRSSAVKTYQQFVSHYQRLWGLVKSFQLDVPGSPWWKHAP
jgi:hypothetical protein